MLKAALRSTAAALQVLALLTLQQLLLLLLFCSSPCMACTSP
jgi:hypothetical protein